MTKFNVGDKVVPIEDLTGYGFPKGEVVEVVNVYTHGTTRIRNENGHEETFSDSRLQLAEPKPTKNQRIKKLESQITELLPLKEEVAELKLIVHQLRTPSTVISELVATSSSVEDTIQYEGQQYKKVEREAREGDVVIFKNKGHEDSPIIIGKPYPVNYVHNNESAYHDGVTKSLFSFYIYAWGRTTKDVDVYELIVEDNPFPPSVIPEPVKSPNQLRAEIIEKAKGFVEDGAKVDLSLNRGRGYIVQFEDACKGGYICDLDFVVNADKRTVVATLRWNTPGQSEIKAKGIAKCHPNNVFNEHIGRTIALGRALGLDVSEFEQAVQPTELVIGMKVELLKQLTHPNNRAGAIKLICDKGFYTEGGPKCAIDSNVAKNSRIINDTNAIYGDTK